ncbi:substrate-binding periplasmic protein [Inhella proteolytica]|uniref:Solute-binding protein family 3/N-terminal domain-containing protein n=1 Tax=Inhella proteolytica TaxID=2795029 RepID=A0A931J445_9BURK|nr:transporter substrate-binding domain-containing protein [Inhella proteolytica]MBH9577931.1 hypothetical protein [Inhella proteolytica]
MRSTLFSLLILVGPATASAAEPIPVHVLEAPRGADGQPQTHPVTGLQERMQKVFDTAGLAVRFEPVPLRRSLQALSRNDEALCVLGVFRTPEREAFGRYSRPVVLEEQQVLIAPARVAAQLRQLATAQLALHDSRFQLLVYEGVSYGVELDRWIALRPQSPVRASSGTARALPMLERGHADLMIGARSELEAMRRREGYPMGRFEAVLLPGMPAPPTRHLLCSRKVDPAWVARFDAALPAVPWQPQPPP